MCVLYVEPVSRSKDYVRSRIHIGSVVCLYTPVSPSATEMEDIYVTFVEDVPLVEFIYLVFTRTPGYRRRFGPLLLCPSSVERYYSPSFVDMIIY